MHMRLATLDICSSEQQVLEYITAAACPLGVTGVRCPAGLAAPVTGPANQCALHAV